ncbi:MAG: ATP-binding protein [Candidatus Thorarchaeota archaeon]
MQTVPVFEPAVVISFTGLVAFIALVSYGLYRYSTGVRYKLWAAGWMVYSITTALSIMIGTAGLEITDSLATSGILLGSIFLFDGANKHQREGSSLLMYILAVGIGLAIVGVGIVLDVSYDIAYTVVGVPSALSCWYSAEQFRRDNDAESLDFWTAYVGFVLWGVSTLLFIPFSLLNLLSVHVLLLSISVMATGSGLLSFFIKTTAENLSAQHQISQLLGSILNHDIRNYAGNLNGAIDQAITSETDHEMWLEMASEVVKDMMDFLEEIRYLTATVTRVQAMETPLNLAGILEGVSERVIREYDIEPERITVEIEENVYILSCKLVKEMFWNIFDNAFKHGTKSLTVRAFRKSKKHVMVEILDRAGGLPTEVQDFLNNPDSLSSRSAPGVGLGIILIRGLAEICDITMEAQDVVEDEQVVGTLFRLQFERGSSNVMGEQTLE